MIIDTHIHIWNFDRAEYPWLKGDTSILNRHYELDELEVEAAAAGVTKGVLVQAANNEEDSRWMLENAAVREWIAGVVGWLPLQDPVRTARLLEDLKINEAAYRHPAALADAVDVAAVLAGWTDAGRSAVLDQLAAVALTIFPLRGTDLLAAGMSPGPRVGIELGRLEQLWIESGFTLDRDGLLRQLRRSNPT